MPIYVSRKPRETCSQSSQPCRHPSPSQSLSLKGPGCLNTVEIIITAKLMCFGDIIRMFIKSKEVDEGGDREGGEAGGKSWSRGESGGCPRILWRRHRYCIGSIKLDMGSRQTQRKLSKYIDLSCYDSWSTCCLGWWEEQPGRKNLAGRKRSCQDFK